MLIRIAMVVLLVAVTALPGGAQAPNIEELEAQVTAVERAFADTMARRDHDAFVSFLSEEVVFLAGARQRRGREAVAQEWRAFFTEGDVPPFSWEPATVVVLDGGSVAMSTGPVRDPTGRRHSTFTSVWRQESPGVWKIILDKGERYCE